MHEFKHEYSVNVVCLNAKQLDSFLNLAVCLLPSVNELSL